MYDYLRRQQEDAEIAVDPRPVPVDTNGVLVIQDIEEIIIGESYHHDIVAAATENNDGQLENGKVIIVHAVIEAIKDQNAAVSEKIGIPDIEDIDEIAVDQQAASANVPDNNKKIVV